MVVLSTTIHEFADPALRPLPVMAKLGLAIHEFRALRYCKIVS
jgi:hypothetical protein